MEPNIVTPSPAGSGQIHMAKTQASLRPAVIEPSSGFQPPEPASYPEPNYTPEAASHPDFSGTTFVDPSHVPEAPAVMPSPTVFRPPGDSQSSTVSQPEMPGSLSNLASTFTPPSTEPEPVETAPVGMVLPGPMTPSADSSLPPVQPSAQIIQPFNPQHPHKSSKKRWLLPGIAALSILLVGGYVFGLYIPNQPQNVYKTGFSRTGQALSAIVNEASSQSTVNAYKKTQITLKVDANYQGSKFNGTFDAKFDASKANAGLNVTSSGGGEPDVKFNAKAISDIPADSDFPNIYFQLNGLKSLGIDNIAPQLLPYDGKWIEVSADYLKSLGDFPTASKTNSKTLTAGDYSELAQVFTKSTNDYVFTNDSSKALFVQKNYLGKETADGLNVYHYQVTINQAHATTYCKDVIDKVYSTAAYKKLPWVNEKNVNQDKTNAQKDCDDQAKSDSTAKDTVYDMWIDAKYKLIYKFRIPDSNDKSIYTDVGQIYKGGSTFTLFANYHNGTDKSDINTKLVSDTKAATTTGSVAYTNADKDSINVTLEAKPYTGDIDTNKPANSVPIQTVLQQLGLDPAALGLDSGNSSSSNTGNSSVDKKARDTERNTDIHSIATQLEVYYNDNGFYPVYSGQINNDDWITANLEGADLDGFAAPNQPSNTMQQTASPDINHYGYVPLAADGKTVCAKAPCAKFRLYWKPEATGAVTPLDSLN